MSLWTTGAEVGAVAGAPITDGIDAGDALVVGADAGAAASGDGVIAGADVGAAVRVAGAGDGAPVRVVGDGGTTSGGILPAPRPAAPVGAVAGPRCAGAVATQLSKLAKQTVRISIFLFIGNLLKLRNKHVKRETRHAL